VLDSTQRNAGTLLEVVTGILIGSVTGVIAESYWDRLQKKQTTDE